MAECGLLRTHTSVVPRHASPAQCFCKPVSQKLSHARTAKDIVESPRARSQVVTKHCLFSQGPSVSRGGGGPGDIPGAFLNSWVN